MEGFAVLRAARTRRRSGHRIARHLQPLRRPRAKRLGFRRGNRRTRRAFSRRFSLRSTPPAACPAMTLYARVLAVSERHVHLRRADQRPARRRARRARPPRRHRRTQQGRGARREFELIKVSYGAIPYLGDRYRILRSGGALGRGCGPLLVARAGRLAAALCDFARKRIAIPGERTTAFMLLQLALGRRPNVADALRPHRSGGRRRSGRRRPDHPRVALHLSATRG